ncbi:MAG: bacteriophage holin [Thermoanaerobaculia bacterium]
MHLNKNGLGLAIGLLWGGSVLVATIVVMMRGGGEHLALLNKFYLGYSVSALGAVLGLVWGFIDGFISGWILAWLYNRFAGA